MCIILGLILPFTGMFQLTRPQLRLGVPVACTQKAVRQADRRSTQRDARECVGAHDAPQVPALAQIEELERQALQGLERGVLQRGGGGEGHLGGGTAGTFAATRGLGQLDTTPAIAAAGAVEIAIHSRAQDGGVVGVVNRD